jgi:hypothetical protein
MPTKTRTAMDLSIQGSTGLRQSGGWVYEEFLPRLHGRQGVMFFREMRDNSSTVGAIMYTIESLIRQAEWRVEPAGDSPDAREWGEFTEGCLEDMSHTWEDTLVEIITHLSYGWALHELVYKLRRGPEATNPSYRSKFDDGRIGWRKMPIRSQDTLFRWDLQDDGGIRGMVQQDPYRPGGAPNVFIPIEKALLFRTGVHKGNPEGRSILRNAVIDFHKLKRITDIEAVGIERDMTGLLTMEVPIELLTAKPGSVEYTIRTEMERMLSALKRDEREFAMVPSEVDPTDGQPTGYKLKLLASGGRRQIDTNAIVLRYMNSITMSVLADFLMLGKQDVGSWALASSKTRLFSFALGAVMDSICAVFNRFAIPRLMQLNAVPVRLHPQLVHGDIESPPLEEIGGYIQALSMAGMLRGGNKPLERKLMELAHFPPPPEEDQPLPGEVVPGADTSTPGQPEGQAGAGQPAANQQQAAAQEDDDDEDDELPPDQRPPAGPPKPPVKKAKLPSLPRWGGEEGAR